MSQTNGISFTFNSVTYYATNISVSRQANEVDCSTTGMESNSFRRYRTSEIENVDIKVDWVGTTIPPDDGVYTFSLSGGLYHTGTKAIATGVSVTGAVGDLIKGTATFKVSYD